MLKLPHNCTSKVMLKILQARLQQYVNHEHPDVQAEFRKGRGSRGQIAIEKTREFQKNIYFCFTEKEMATHSGILAWKILWTQEPGRLQSMG